MGKKSSIETASLSHTGLVRSHNEDSYLVDESIGLFLVADGMGGHRAGDVASQMATQAVHERVKAELAAAGSDDGAVMRLIRTTVAHANQLIYQASTRDGNTTGMGTTLSLLLLRPVSALVAHIGDSRIYQLRNGHLKAVTRDHSLLQAQVGAGIISDENARFSHNRNLLIRALGIEPKVEADLQEIDVKRGDLLLLCSDGLTTMVDDSDIELVLGELAANPTLAAKCLVEIANDNGGHDNITVVLVRIDELGEVAPPGLFARLWAWLFGK